MPDGIEPEEARSRRAQQARPVRRRAVRLEMSLVDEDGAVIASVTEPFEVGQFDLAAARQGVLKLLAGLGGITDQAT
jgi:hypothetical protein